MTSTNVLPLIGMGYTFNSETGMYTLTGVQRVDPTTLDYENNDYYTTWTDIFENGNNLAVASGEYDTALRKIKSVTKSEGTYTSAKGETYKTIEYYIMGYTYTPREVESDKSDKGIYQMNDEYGTSYYYRGSVNNNYVLFGGHYWRIIRINGDGSIRLLYSGSKKDAQGEELFARLTDSSLGYSSTNRISFNTNNGNPAYVGYMYGNTLNSSYAETHANEVDSTIKKYLDSWYRQNIVDKRLSKYIADAGFCNDRSLSPSNVGDGYTTSKLTHYDGDNRYKVTRSPALNCQNSNDLFTTSSSGKGNKALIYPIGLMTIDELSLSGHSWGKYQTLSYTASSSYYWTMTPSLSGSISGDEVFRMGYVGNTYKVSNEFGVRPVINLKVDTEISGGIGTSNEPFIVK